MASDRFQRVTDLVRKGQYAVRVEVQPGDDPSDESGERAEVGVMTDANDNRIDENESSGIQYYAFSVRLAPDWQPPEPDWHGVWGIIFQQYKSSQGGVSDHYWQHGFYRPKKNRITHVLWLDGLTRGNTFDGVVQAAFPP